jgi:hypothetical protein
MKMMVVRCRRSLWCRGSRMVETEPEEEEEAAAASGKLVG